MDKQAASLAPSLSPLQPTLGTARINTPHPSPPSSFSDVLLPRRFPLSSCRLFLPRDSSHRSPSSSTCTPLPSSTSPFVPPSAEMSFLAALTTTSLSILRFVVLRSSLYDNVALRFSPSRRGCNRASLSHVTRERLISARAVFSSTRHRCTREFQLRRVRRRKISAASSSHMHRPRYTALLVALAYFGFFLAPSLIARLVPLNEEPLVPLSLPLRTRNAHSHRRDAIRLSSLSFCLVIVASFSSP